MTIDFLSKAEVGIAKILSLLEIETGTLVQAIEINDHEITALSDKRREIVRKVSIRLARLPGSSWVTD